MTRALRFLTPLALVFALALPSVAAAQANPAVHAVVAFINLVDPGLVQELEDQHGDDMAATAAALLRRVEDGGLVSPAIVNMMRTAMTTGVMPRDTLVLFLADLANGKASLASMNPRDAEDALRAFAPNLVVPAGDANGNLGDDDIATLMAEFALDLDGILAAIRDAYDDAITPTNGAG